MIQAATSLVPGFPCVGCHVAKTKMWCTVVIKQNSQFLLFLYKISSLSDLQLITAENVDIFGFQEMRLDVGWMEAETECQACRLSSYLPEYQVV